MFNFYTYLAGTGILPSTRRYERKQLAMTERHTRFCDIRASADFKRYLSLKTYVESAEYTADRRHTKWKNRKQSKPGKCRREFRQLRRSATIKQYIRLHKKYAAVFAELERWHIVLEDLFHDSRLAAHWNTKPFWSISQLSKTYVQRAEKHGLNPENVYIQDGTLLITTRKEENSTIAWDENYGFIPGNLHYTSGIANTATHYKTNPVRGKVEVKLRVPAAKNVYHACWLNCEKKTPAVSIFNFCNNKYEVGVYHEEYDDKTCRPVKLNHTRFYIIQLEWNEKHLIWRVNGKKVAQKANTISQPMFLHLASGVVGKVRAARLPAHLEIDWVRISEEN